MLSVGSLSSEYRTTGVGFSGLLGARGPRPGGLYRSGRRRALFADASERGTSAEGGPTGAPPGGLAQGSHADSRRTGSRERTTLPTSSL